MRRYTNKSPKARAVPRARFFGGVCWVLLGLMTAVISVGVRRVAAAFAVLLAYEAMTMEGLAGGGLVR